MSPWRSAVQLGVYFKFILSFDNPTVTTSDYVELIYAWLENARPLSLSLQLSASLTLCHDSYVPLYAQTQTDSWLHDFWLRRESASAHATSVVVWAQQVLAIFLPLSSVLCSNVLWQSQLKKTTTNKQKKNPENIWTVCLFLSQMITATYLLWLISVVICLICTWKFGTSYQVRTANNNTQCTTLCNLTWQWCYLQSNCEAMCTLREHRSIEKCSKTIYIAESRKIPI